MPNQRPIAIPPSFSSLSSDLPIEIYTRNLPHWRQEGATYFVTFRLQDSVPEAVLRDLRIEVRQTYRRLGIAPNCKVEKGAKIEAALREMHQSQIRKFESILDQGVGSCILKQSDTRRILAEVIEFHDGKTYNLFTYVIMPNHCHALLKPLRNKRLQKSLQSIKSFSSRRIGQAGQVWQKESYDTIIRDEQHYRHAARYIIKNPTKANLRQNEYDFFRWDEDETVD